ncbi:MAG: hypothetical protein EBU90_07245 [Proteobacteria bacterium]|nr:hypothetical protein [Pseudomonadota bacterium]
MADDKNRLRKTYSFFRQQPVYASGGGGGAGGADERASYLVLALTSSLPNERVFIPSTGLKATDSGANGNYTLAINDSVVATITGSTFTGILIAAGGSAASPDSFLGKAAVGTHPWWTNAAMFGNSSLSHVGAGNSGNYALYQSAGGTTSLNAPTGTSVIISNNDNQIAQFTDTIINLAGVASTAQTVTLGQTTGASSLTLNAGTGKIIANGAAVFNDGLSGSLTKLVDGTSYLIAGSNVTITSASNGAVTISSTGGSGTPAGSDQQIQFNNGGSFGASANLNFNSSTNTLSLTGSFGIQGSITPDLDSTYTLGTPDKRWAHIYTGDLHLRNERGDWTIVEEKDYLCVVNNITGKKYKMMLQPLD